MIQTTHSNGDAFDVVSGGQPALVDKCLRLVIFVLERDVVRNYFALHCLLLLEYSMDHNRPFAQIKPPQEQMAMERKIVLSNVLFLARNLLLRGWLWPVWIPSMLITG